jgi:hypothetical protein
MVADHSESGNDAFAVLLGKIAADPTARIRTLSQVIGSEPLPSRHDAQLLYKCHMMTAG